MRATLSLNSILMRMIYESITKDNRLKLIVQEEQEHVAELKDQGLNELIKIVVPCQYLNMVMEA